MPPEPGLFFVHDPDDVFEHIHSLREAAREDPSHLFVAVSPVADNVRTLGGDILRALGKDPNVSGSERREHTAWLRTLLWLQLSPAQEMYISRAHLLKPWLLEHLMGAACLCGVRLNLIFQGGALRRSQQRLLADWPVEERTVADLLAGQSRKRRHAKRNRQVVAKKRLPAVPMDDFTSFRAAARQLLNDEDFRTVDAELLDAVDRTSAYIRRADVVDEAGLCEHLRDLIADSEWLPQIITRVRGAQVAAFHAGYLMRANLDVLAATRTPRVALDIETLLLIERYDNPRLTALMVLTTATGRELRDFEAMTLNDVTDQGQRIMIQGEAHRLDARAAQAVEVLVRERLAYFASDSDPLFAYTPGTGRRHGPRRPWTSRGMSDSLKRIERESNLMLTAHLTDAGQRDALAWARRRGIVLQRI